MDKKALLALKISREIEIEIYINFLCSTSEHTETLVRVHPYIISSMANIESRIHDKFNLNLYRIG